MRTTLRIGIELASGQTRSFEFDPRTRPVHAERDGAIIAIEAGMPARLTVVPPPGDRILRLQYDLLTDLKNFHKAIVPDTGRGYMDRQNMVGFWRQYGLSAVNNVFMPIYIFLGQDLYSQLAFGVIGEPFESEFQTLEPRAHRALVAHMRRLSIRIRRGTDLYPIPERIAAARDDGAIVEHIYLRAGSELAAMPWTLCLRDFAAHQKRLFGLQDITHDGALDPLWCSWTDWFSDDVTAAVVLDNVRMGCSLGIRNYIVDDGWFGPGLDNERDVPLNIGDWEPDPRKIPDMAALVRAMHDEGARALIWCAPHAVAAGAQCFAQRRPWLIQQDETNLLTTGNGFHSLCFQNPQARQTMADICASFIERWDMDGAKYDLFNCVPPVQCQSPHHSHDTDSMLTGLALTMEAIDRRCRTLKPDYIVELKQNYATPFLSRWGSITRAGDTPYDTEGNFKRTLYIQAYTPYAVNDYMTVTPQDSPQETACIVIKMMAVGVPSYSVDFKRLNPENRQVLAHYHRWYQSHLDRFHSFRIPLHPLDKIWQAASAAGREDIVFMLNDADRLTLTQATIVLNGTFQAELLLQAPWKGSARIETWNAVGERAADRTMLLDHWTAIAAPPGGMMRILADADMNKEDIQATPMSPIKQQGTP